MTTSTDTTPLFEASIPVEEIVFPHHLFRSFNVELFGGNEEEGAGKLLLYGSFSARNGEGEKRLDAIAYAMILRFFEFDETKKNETEIGGEVYSFGFRKYNSCNHGSLGTEESGLMLTFTFGSMKNILGDDMLKLVLHVKREGDFFKIRLMNEMQGNGEDIALTTAVGFLKEILRREEIANLLSGKTPPEQTERYRETMNLIQHMFEPESGKWAKVRTPPKPPRTELKLVR
ncbi:Uncharacterised protein [Candidatus Gugararchaeum adminiculabundum]|nr:Uncharacterised protein [Candidatus Gugararchaeum adminiculabundum]